MKAIKRKSMILVFALLLFTFAMFISILGDKLFSSKEVVIPRPTNFEECARSRGSTIQESYPEVCITSAGARFVASTTPIPVPTATANTQPTSSFCGGIAGKMCPQGFKCEFDGAYPDSGGRCVKDTK